MPVSVNEVKAIKKKCRANQFHAREMLPGSAGMKAWILRM